MRRPHTPLALVFVVSFAMACGAEPRAGEPPSVERPSVERPSAERPSAEPDVAPEPEVVAAPAPGAAVELEAPPHCPEGTHAVLVQERRCAPCARGASPCPCAPPVYRCEPVAPPSAPDDVPCGEQTCAPGQACCAIDCSGTVGCRSGRACPALSCGACPAGTCRRGEGMPWGRPTGQTGNGCCRCGADGLCSHPCRCAALDTPIDTPDGSRPVASLAPGDLVFSIDGGRRRAVPVVRVHRASAVDHHVIRVIFASGATVRMSPGHPTADGRTFGELRAGDRLGGVAIVEATLERYELSETADILPASDTGTYFASGVLVGSTLFEPTPSADGAARRAAE